MKSARDEQSSRSGLAGMGAAFRAMRDDDAFAPREPQAAAPAGDTCFDRDRRALRIKALVLGLATLLVFLASLCIGSSDYTIHTPGEVVDAIGLWFKITFEGITGGKEYSLMEVQALCPAYYQVIDRVGIMYIALISGVIITLSGMIYQGAFRNPVAAPTMLGVAGGVNMGLLVFTWVYGAAAYYDTFHHITYAYTGAILVLVVVLGLSYLINGKGRFSVVDMLLVGSIVSQVLGQIVLYVSYYVFDDSQWLIYTNLNEVLDVNTEPMALVVLTVAAVVTFIPVFAMRFRLNALSFDEQDSCNMGVNLQAMRYGMLALATVMVIAAMVHTGMIGMVALVAPFISRAFFGAEYRKQVVGNIFIGALMVVACRAVADLLSIQLHAMGFTFAFPIGVVASLVCLPIFVWILALQQRTWE